MTIQKWTRQFAMVVAAGSVLAKEMQADAMLVLLEGQTDWEKLRMAVPNIPKLIVAADSANDLAGASEAGLIPLVLNKEQSPLLERLQHALLEAVAAEIFMIRVGEDVEQRRSFIQRNAKDVRFLDI